MNDELSIYPTKETELIFMAKFAAAHKQSLYEISRKIRKYQHIIECGCGSIFKLENMQIHFKSKKHYYYCKREKCYMKLLKEY